MKVIVTRKNEEGSYDDVGMRNRYLLNQYTTLKGLVRWGIHRKWLERGVRLEIFQSNLYQDEPDQTIYMNS